MGAIAKTDPAVLAAQERQFQARQQQTIAAAQTMPELALNASLTNHLYDELTPTTRTSANSVGVGLTWPIIKSIAALRGVRAAESNMQAADAAVRAQENKLLLDIVSAIADYDRAAQVAELRRQRHARLQKYMADQKKRNALGEISQTDLQQIRGRLAAAQSARAQADAEKAGALALLASFGLSATHNITLADPGAHLPKSEERAIAEAHLNNPAEQERNYRLSAAENEVAQAEYELLPSLNLGLTAGQNTTLYSNATSVTNNNVAVRLDLSAPLFDGGRRRAELLQQQSRVREMQYESHNVTKNIEATIRSDWYRYQAAVSSVNYARTRSASAKKALSGIRTAIEVGARSVSDELAALDEVTEAEVSLVNAYYDINVFGHQLMAHTNRIAKAYSLSAQR